MTIAAPRPDARKNLREVVKRKREQIAADNTAARAERNARRWKAERDPLEYQKQLDGQRSAYAERIASEEGREVRQYAKVAGNTPEERKANYLARDAARKREERSKSTQEAKDRQADNKAARRWRKKGWSEAQIEAALLLRISARQNGC